MTEPILKETFVEYLETARQAGKSETSGLVAAMYRTLDDVLEKQNRMREHVYLLLILILVIIYFVSFVYVFTTRVTQQELDRAVAQSMETYLELEGYTLE